MTNMVKGRLAGLALSALPLTGISVSAASATPPTGATSVPASFDCSKAVRAVDRFICADAALRWQDLALSRSYRAARDALGSPARAALIAEQRDWLRERDRRCVADRTFAEVSAPSSEVRDQAYGCLMTVYLGRRRDLGDRVAAPIALQAVAEIDLRPITSARADLVENGRLAVAGMRLSPDGTHVAILLPSEELDLPDQLWLYRVADHKLMAVTPPPDRQRQHPAEAVAAITALAWQGDRVFALAALWGDSGDSEQGPTAIYTATESGGQRLRDVPAKEMRWESITGGLVIEADELPDDDAATESLRGNETDLVWTADRGHGTVDLHIRVRAPGAVPYLVGWGGWELSQFLFDASRTLLVYSADTGISLFDMAKRAERRIAGTARGDQPYAMSADLGTILWSTRNRCGDEFLAAPDTDAPERFCLGAMTDAPRMTPPSSGR